MSAKNQVGKYFEALERLKARNAPINNDAVSLEAGSGRGSIKKSRPAYIVPARKPLFFEEAGRQFCGKPPGLCIHSRAENNCSIS